MAFGSLHKWYPKGEFSFCRTEQQICKSKECLAYSMCKFKAAFCAKTFGKPSHVIIVFSSTALHCKAKRDKAGLFFVLKFLAHVSWYEVILSESHPNLIPSVVILHEASPKWAGWRLDSALFLTPSPCMEAWRGQQHFPALNFYSILDQLSSPQELVCNKLQALWFLSADLVSTNIEF